ncbi:MAG: hypothetical protein A3E79_16555 [Burkholderiales bacterium RIFCSPHIGHO2_12_FULL_61_11]|nr:MAG: hypothetical protein A3E79_16555 [Burkholderiales bacterium RIFCSPHIGHO2_12_FULL_61_11]
MKTSRLLRILAAVAIVFGALTIFSGGRALFGGALAQAAVGNAVDFVLWFNFLAGFAYVLAGVGLWLGRRWAAWTAGLLALATAVVAGAFGLHVMGGGAYEMRTVGALALRLGFWVVVAVAALRGLKPGLKR